MYKKKNLKCTGNEERPRLVIFRSNKHFYIQVIDDKKMHTILSSSTLSLKLKKKNKESIIKLGQDISEKIIHLGIKSVIFDRNEYKFLKNSKEKPELPNGNVALLASIIRENNIKI